jgi:rubrerythrin
MPCDNHKPCLCFDDEGVQRLPCPYEVPRADYRGRCLDCGDSWPETEPPAVCPECGSLDVVTDNL